MLLERLGPAMAFTCMFLGAGTARVDVLTPARVQDWEPLSGVSDAAKLAAVADSVYFSAAPAAFGRDLWKCDCTEAGSVLVSDIRPGGCPLPTQSAVVGDLPCLVAHEGTRGLEPWKSDGAEARTLRGCGLQPGSGSSRPFDLTHVDDSDPVAAHNDSVLGGPNSSLLLNEQRCGSQTHRSNCRRIPCTDSHIEPSS